VSEHRRFVALVRSFPVLARYAPGITDDDIDLLLLDAWAAHTADASVIDRIVAQGKAPFPGGGAKCAARFVLHLWDSRREWACGQFDLFRSLQEWDDEQRAAFQAWVARPWRP
jgi:hypothetical protein